MRLFIIALLAVASTASASDFGCFSDIECGWGFRCINFICEVAEHQEVMRDDCVMPIRCEFDSECPTNLACIDGLCLA